jgi:hypothetical protein
MPLDGSAGCLLVSMLDFAQASLSSVQLWGTWIAMLLLSLAAIASGRLYKRPSSNTVFSAE